MPEVDPNVIPAFERDPTCTRLESTVVEVGTDGGRSYVILADTILYPEGGGQPADHGSVNGVSVVDVQKRDGAIRHYTTEPVEVGAAAIELDWERRLDHMQQHSGQHLLTAIAQDRFGWATTAFHLGDRYCDIEVDAADVDQERLDALEDAVAAEIRAARTIAARRVSLQDYADIEVRSRGLPAGHTGSVRLVEIDGIDLNTCGGTHCASTSELEALKLLGTDSVRGGTRILYVAGARLRRHHGAHHDRNAELRALLGVSDEELAAGVTMRIEQLKEAQRGLRQMESDLAVASAAQLVGAADRLISAHWPDRTLPFLQQVARQIQATAPDRVIFLTAGESDGSFLLGAGEESDFDVGATGPRVAELLNGRGGGSGRMYQGRAGNLAKRDEVPAILE